MLEKLENRITEQIENGLLNAKNCGFSSVEPSTSEIAVARTAYLNWIKKNLYPATSEEEMNKIIQTADIRFIQRGLWGEAKGILKSEPRLI